MSSFTQKKLRVTLVMTGANSVFPGTNSNTLTLENMRMSAKVQAVARQATQLDLAIFGMKREDMDALTVAWANPPIVRDNFVILEADNGSGFVQVFKGAILEAQPDYRSAPEVSFMVLAMTGYSKKISPAEPESYPEGADIDTLAAGIVGRMGEDWVFVNGGATGVLSAGVQLWGSLWDQLAQVCQATNTDFYVFGDTVLIVPFGQPRTDQPAVKLSPDSGLIGYPNYERAGLAVSALFDPAFLCAVPVDIEGNVPSANGRWYPYSLAHFLETRNPRGQWITQMMCTRVIV